MFCLVFMWLLLAWHYWVPGGVVLPSASSGWTARWWMMWGRQPEMTELLRLLSSLGGQPGNQPFPVWKLHSTKHMFWLLGGEECQLGNNKINVEYFGWSGMKQEVPKVCPRVSLQQWQCVALQALVLDVGKGLGAGVQCWSEGRFLVWCREGWFASPVQTAVLQHTCRLYAGSL